MQEEDAGGGGGRKEARYKSRTFTRGEEKILKRGWLQQQHGRPQNRGESAPPTKVTLKHDFGPPSLGRHKKF